MENTQIVAERIKKEAQSQGISVKKILEECDVDKNIVNKLASGKDTGTQTIVKIANYLKVSVDYLLGRSDNPNIIADTYINGDNNGIQAVNNGNNSNLTVNSNKMTDTEELVEMIQDLPLVKRAEAVLYLNDLKNKK